MFCSVFFLPAGFSLVSADTLNDSDVYWITDTGTPVNFGSWGTGVFPTPISYSVWKTTDSIGYGSNFGKACLSRSCNLAGRSVFSFMWNAKGNFVNTDYGTHVYFTVSDFPKKGTFNFVGGFLYVSYPTLKNNFGEHTGYVRYENLGGDFKGIRISAYDSTGHSISKTVTVDSFSYLDSYKHSYSFDYDFSEFSNDIVKLQITLSRDAWSGGIDLPGVIFSAFVTGVGSSNVQDIITAITNQTDKLLEQPDNNEFSEDKIKGQVDNIQEKMGVLSFGETALKDFVGIWHTDGEAVIYLPEFNMTIQGENYKIWDKYTYNLNELNDDFGFLLTAIRTASSALLWFMVLQFLIKQFEEFINR